MPQIKKISIINGERHAITAFTGLHVSDTDHARIDIIRYLQGYRYNRKVELLLDTSEMHPAGGRKYADEVENY